MARLVNTSTPDPRVQLHGTKAGAKATAGVTTAFLPRPPRPPRPPASPMSAPVEFAGPTNRKQPGQPAARALDAMMWVRARSAAAIAVCCAADVRKSRGAGDRNLAGFLAAHGMRDAQTGVSDMGLPGVTRDGVDGELPLALSTAAATAQDAVPKLVGSLSMTALGRGSAGAAVAVTALSATEISSSPPKAAAVADLSAAAVQRSATQETEVVAPGITVGMELKQQRGQQHQQLQEKSGLRPRCFAATRSPPLPAPPSKAARALER